MGHDYGGEPRLVMRAGGVGWVNGIVTGLLALDAVLVAALAVFGLMSVLAALGAFAGIAVLAVFIRNILPQRFEVYDDRLVLVFGLWRQNIGLEDIETAREAGKWQAFAYWGMRLATAPGQATEIRRVRSNLFGRPNLIISPEDRTVFLAELNSALRRLRQR